MYWHCGLLDDPETSAFNPNPIRHSNWQTLSEEFERELRIWLAMPGFTLSYHMETLERDAREIRQFSGGYDELEDDVLMNWVSATRDDCIKLGHIRPPKGDLPFITKIEIRRDYMRGMVQKHIADEFGVRPSTVNKFCFGVLPDEVEQLPIALQKILNDDPFVSGLSREQARKLWQKRAAERKLLFPPESNPTPASEYEHVPFSPEILKSVREAAPEPTPEPASTYEQTPISSDAWHTIVEAAKAWRRADGGE